MSSDSDCQIVEESPAKKSISCENIPEIFLDKLVAKKHFSQFGRINRFILRPKRLSCTVEFESSDSAAQCFDEGGVYKDQKFKIFWTPEEKSGMRSDEIAMDPDVQTELDMMSGGGSIIRKPKVLSSIDSFLKKTERLPAPSIVAPPKTIRKIPKSTEIDPKLLQARLEFEQLAKKPANTAEERYRVLDSKDKYIRSTMTKTTDINTAKSTVGTCADMCPEKERYMREAKCQIASYEILDVKTQIDHNMAVKQYSRSSADQESPLPHELRTEDALKMTMVYLLQYIIDQSEDETTNISDWFHFVWDRTRSIRKDITQQELCSPEAVKLVEQCARFHIHCSARLVAEDPSVFDNKINSENLTKCLQSLKYMYHDLNLKGIKCPNEAEFRAYIVLLNMNDGNFLWEFKQISEEILKSNEMRFALDVYFALAHNNYFKFFELVKKTSYLNACILLRYFNQVRLRALLVILKVYASRTPTNMTISYLTSILAFEDDEATISFLEFYGMSCDRTSYNVYIDNKNYYCPDDLFTMERAYNVVESKRDRSVSETIAGYNVTDDATFDNHEIEDSFDENGLFKEDLFRDVVKSSKTKEESPDEADHIFKMPSPTSMSPKFMLHKSSPPGSSIHSRLGPRTEVSQPVPPSAPLASSTPTTLFAKLPPVEFSGISPLASSANIFGRSQFQKNGTGTDGIIKHSSIFTQPAATESKSVFGSFGGQINQQTFGNNIFGQRREDPRIREQELQRQKVVELAKLKILQEENDRMAKAIAEQERQSKIRQEEERLKMLKEQEEELRKQLEVEKMRQELILDAERRRRKEENRKRIENSSEAIFDNLAAEIVDEKLKEIAEKYVYDHQVIKLVPSKIFSQISNDLVDEYVIDFLLEEAIMDKGQKDREIKILAKYFQNWRKTVNQRLENRNKIENTPFWVPNRTIAEHVADCHVPTQALNLENMKRYLTGSPEVIKIPKEDATKIDIFELVKNKLLDQNHRIANGLIKSQVYWKLTFSIPYKGEEGSAGFYFYINKWLNKIFDKSDPEKNQFLLLEAKSPKNLREQIVLCVRLLKGLKLQNEAYEIEPTAIDNSNGLLFFMTPLCIDKAKRRLHSLLQNAYNWGPIPVTIVVYDAKIKSVEYFADMLGVDELFEQQKISDIEIILHDNKSLKPVLENALVDFAEKYSVDSVLEMVSNVCFISSTLGDEFWQRIRLSAERNEKLAEATHNPNSLINIYTQAVERVLNLVQHNFKVYPEFPREFERFVPKRLYDIPLGIEFFPKDWKDPNRQKNLMKYFQALKIKPFEHDKFFDFMSIEKAILYFVTENLGQSRKSTKIANLMYKELLSQGHEHPKMVSWINTIAIYTNAVLQLRWNEFGSLLPNEVIYQKVEMNSFAKTLWWLKDLKVDLNFSSIERIEAVLNEPIAKKAKLSISFTKDEMNKILEKGWSIVKLADEKLNKCREVESSTKELSKNLDETFYEQEKVMRINRQIWKNNLRR